MEREEEDEERGGMLIKRVYTYATGTRKWGQCN